MRPQRLHLDASCYADPRRLRLDLRHLSLLPGRQEMEAEIPPARGTRFDPPISVPLDLAPHLSTAE